MQFETVPAPPWQPLVQDIGRKPRKAPDCGPAHDERHLPEQTTLYRLVQQHAADFIAYTDVSTGG